MNRRYYLSVVGAGLLTGCASDGETADASTGDATSTPTATETPTETPIRTETEAPDETPTETETPDDTEIELPDDPNPDLESIETDVAAAIDTYTDSGGPNNNAFSDIRPTERVNTSNMRNPLFDARDTRDDIDRSVLSSDEQTRYDQLEGAYWFAWWLVPAHNGLYEAYRNLQSGWDYILNRNWGNAESTWNNVTRGTNEAQTNLDRLKNNSDSSDMAGFERLSPDDYTAKVDQFEMLKNSMEELGGLMASIAEGFQYYDAGGENAYFNAEQNFSDAAETLEEGDWGSLFNVLVEDAICVADAMANGCELLDRAQRTFDEDRGRALVEDAQDEFDECEIVDDDINIEVT